MVFSDIIRVLVVVLLAGVALVGVAALFSVLDNLKEKRGETREQYLARQQAAGKIVKTTYTATRAFMIHEYEDEGPHYFIELADGKVIYVTGQTLYDYEPDEEEGKPRRFPCTDFTITWDDGYAIDIQCRGQVIEPFAEFNGWEDDVASLSEIMEDGKATIDKSLDVLVASITKQPEKPTRKRLFG